MKNKKLILFLSFFVFIFLLFNDFVFADGEETNINGKLNQIIIKYRENDEMISKENKNSCYGYSVLSDSNNTEYIEILSFDSEKEMEEKIKSIKNNPNIVYIEKNYIDELFYYPNDEYYPYQWYIENLNSSSVIEKYSLDTSKEVKIAVIDSGIDINHPDLQGRILEEGYDFLNNSFTMTDQNGHGTFIGGIISAIQDNYIGIAGIAGNANIKILPLKVANKKGEATHIDIIRAIDYAISEGVDIINLSLGSPVYNVAYNDAIQRAIANNIVVVSSIGNQGNLDNPINYPAAYPGVISVGSIDITNTRAKFSNYNNYLDIVAPGVNIFSTKINGQYGYGHGTSFSSPMVAAAASLVKLANPSLNVEEVKEILVSSARDLGDKEYDIYYGYGALDIDLAVRKAKNYSVEGITLDKEELTIDLSKEPIYHQDEIAFSNVKELEPNNTFKTANFINIDSTITGSITSSKDDVDYYYFNVEEEGKLYLSAIWSDINLIGKGWEDDLQVFLFDENEEIVSTAHLVNTNGVSKELVARIKPGKYYIKIYQSSDYSFYTDKEYNFDIKFSKYSEDIEINVENKLMQIASSGEKASPSQRYRVPPDFCRNLLTR